MVRNLSQADENLNDVLMDEWGQRYGRVVRVEKRWKWFFISAYVIGGLLIGIPFIRTKLAET